MVMSEKRTDTENNSRAKLSLGVYAHQTTASLYYPVGASGNVDYLVTDISYRTYKSGNSGALTGYTYITSGRQKYITVVNGVPSYASSVSKSFGSNTYVANAQAYGAVTFTGSKQTINLNTSRIKP